MEGDPLLSRTTVVVVLELILHSIVFLEGHGIA